MKVFGSALRRNAGEVYIPDGCIIVLSVARIWAPHLRLGNHQDVRSKADPPTLLSLQSIASMDILPCSTPPISSPRGRDGPRERPPPTQLGVVQDMWNPDVLFM